MKKFCLLILFFSLNLFAADYEPQKIINGTIVDSKNSPYVWVHENNFDNPKNSSAQTGTLISKKHVIVAAHLISFPTTPKHYEITINGKNYKVTKISIPKSYINDLPCTDSNIAILTLEKPVPSSVKILPITTNLNDSKENKIVTYYGYGCDLDCSGEKADSDECLNCYGTLRKGNSRIISIYQGVARLEKNGDTSGYAYYDGAPAVTVRASKIVIKKIRTKKGKIKKVKKTVTQDAIIGLWACDANPSYPVYMQQGAIPLLRSKNIIKFIKQATNRKAKFF